MTERREETAAALSKATADIAWRLCQGRTYVIVIVRVVGSH
jgi:hypothetical protein